MLTRADVADTLQARGLENVSQTPVLSNLINEIDITFTFPFSLQSDF